MEFLHQLWLQDERWEVGQPAIVDSSAAYQPQQLHDQSGQCARWLQGLGVRPGNRVMVVADASFSSICMLAACSMVDATFTIISPEVPIIRRSTIVNEIEPTVILVDSLSAVAPEFLTLDPVFRRYQWSVTSLTGVDVFRTRAVGTDAAWIVFTSGSTGKPKGIVMSHAAVLSFWDGLIAHMQPPLGSRYASLSPLQFDFSLLDIGLCLGSGTTLYFPNRLLLHKPTQLLKVLSQWGITHMSSVPTVWKLMLKLCGKDISEFTSLKRIVFAGEHFPAEHMRSIHDQLPGVDFYNIYGQSESIACTFEVLGPRYFLSETPHAPIGKGHRAIEMMLWDSDGRRISEPDQIGELVIRGLPLFSGYWKLPKETATRLIDDPAYPEFAHKVFKTGDNCYFDVQGCFYFVGRCDNQIKVNGNRVELEEIERHLNAFDGISNSCVLTVGDGQDTELHAVVVVQVGGQSPQSLEAQLRAHLSGVLPGYMLPRKYHLREDIPITANGKNDRQKLKSLLVLD
ncbi:hypothetical protein D8B24_03150 [Verminephrobacter aporrectodeae subsp. tuberculatae]|uniref:AMP-binding protein n=1 Tax=Verminephrobacter aporrectodeae TaxID=1110389 RepID=UPI002243F976|nr:AMP-binding protein [Verminephrobacter aporrectodeae]MCW8206076.1 hypothetical protein [Verminephrobacter aporrectodeae subsp. tuberculatae]